VAKDYKSCDFNNGKIINYATSKSWALKIPKTKKIRLIAKWYINI